MFFRKSKDKDVPLPPRLCHCTHCGRILQVSPHAFSVNCPYCNQRVCIEDHFIASHHIITNIETSGRVAIAPTGHVRARMRVFDLQVEGEIFGQVNATGKVSIAAGARVVGDVRAERLEVADGAHLCGFYQIGPRPPEQIRS